MICPETTIPSSGRLLLSEGNSSVIALTSGEPSGVGLELALKAWQKLKGSNPFFLIADRSHINSLEQTCPVIEIQSPEYCLGAFDQALPFLHYQFPTSSTPGHYNPENASGVVGSIETAVQFALDKKIAGICTNPITKEVFHHAGRKDYSGHTEFIAHLCGKDCPVMMLAGRKLKVVPLTRHIPLRSVHQSISKELLKQALEISLQSLRKDFGLQQPRIAVSGLNPHAGEGGLLGLEEKEIIEPVIRDFQTKGENVQGPFSADTMFHKKFRKTYDLAVSMYHDQALIPIKTLDFYKSVNVTLGLPIVRTSPDHGTALDMAGKGKARADSLIEAIKLAGIIQRNRIKNDRHPSPTS